MQKRNPFKDVVAHILARHDEQWRLRLFGGELAYWRAERSNNQMLPDRHFCIIECSERAAPRAKEIILGALSGLNLDLQPSIVPTEGGLLVMLNHDDFARMKSRVCPVAQRPSNRMFTDVFAQTGFLSADTYLKLEELLRDDEAHSSKGYNHVDQHLEHMRRYDNVSKGSMPSFADLHQALRSIGKWEQAYDKDGNPTADDLMDKHMRRQVDTLSNWLGLTMERLYRNSDQGLGANFIERLNKAVQARGPVLPPVADAERKYATHLQTGGALLRDWANLPTHVKQHFIPKERYLFDHTEGAAAETAARIDLYDTMLSTVRALRNEAIAALGEDAMRPKHNRARGSSSTRIYTQGEGHGAIHRELRDGWNEDTMPIPDNAGRQR